MYDFKFEHYLMLSKQQQIVRSIKIEIEKGGLARNEKLLSINQFNAKFNVARDTVEKAYNILRDEGYITSIKGKGYFVLNKVDRRLKILLVFNKLSSYKKIIYEAFIATLGNYAKVDLHIHHYSPALLKESLELLQNKKCINENGIWKCQNAIVSLLRNKYRIGNFDNFNVI